MTKGLDTICVIHTQLFHGTNRGGVSRPGEKPLYFRLIKLVASGGPTLPLKTFLSRCPVDRSINVDSSVASDLLFLMEKQKKNGFFVLADIE